MVIHGSLNNIKIAILHKSFHRFNAIPIWDFFSRNWQADLKIHVEMDGTQNKNNAEKEQSWKTHTSLFQTSYKATIIKTVR